MLEAVGGRWVAVGEHQQRRAVQPRAGDAIDDGGHAGTERGQAGAGLAAHFRLRDRGDRRRRLGGGEDERQTGAPGGLDEIEIAAAARHAEQKADPRAPQMANDEVGDGDHEGAGWGRKAR